MPAKAISLILNEHSLPDEFIPINLVIGQMSLCKVIRLRKNNSPAFRALR